VPVAADPVPSLKFEREAWRAGARWVAGIDEVGVGPLAGPVTAGVVVLPPGRRFKWYSLVRDSKVIPEPTRLTLSAQIRRDVSFAIGWASPEEIDRIGILPARRLCMLRALEKLDVRPDHIISDALDLPVEGVRPIIDADALSVAVAAASIVAKVERDALMVDYCARYRGYAFCRNKGYPTPQHKRLLQQLGPCEIHRRSYAPVAQFNFQW
jgi:ribonuclease HII